MEKRLSVLHAIRVRHEARIGGELRLLQNALAKAQPLPFVLDHVMGPVPEVGADTDRILSDIGYGAEDIAALRKEGVI